MSGSPTRSILLISSRAEEGKDIGTHLRTAFEPLHFEVAYTLPQGLHCAGQHPWQCLILDLTVFGDAYGEMIEQLQHCAPQADLLLYTDDSRMSPLQAMRSGASALLHRRSTRFLEDLTAIIRERHASVMTPEGLAEISAIASRERDRQANTIVYELCPSGFFTYVSENVRSLLGYDPAELLGKHFSSIVAPDSKAFATQRFNERRAGARATRMLDLRLMPKTRIGHIPDAVTSRLCAKGLYAAPDLFVGTVGLIQELPRPIPAIETSRRHIASGSQQGTESSQHRATPHSPVSDPAHQDTTLEPIWQSIEQFLGQLDRRPLRQALQDTRETSASLARHIDAVIQPDTAVHSAIASQPETVEHEAPEQLLDLTIGRAAPIAPPQLSISHDVDDTGTHTAPRTIERRTFPRKDVQLASCIFHREGQWPGCTSNIGQGGLALDISSFPEPLFSRTVSIALLSDVLFMDVWGTISSEVRAEHTRLHVRFGAMDDVKRSVLQSFLEILDTHPNCLRVQITVAGPDSQTRVPTQTQPVATDAVAETERRHQDRRSDYRIPIDMPVWLCWQSPHGVTTRLRAHLRDIHLTGARIQVERRLPAGMTRCWITSAHHPHDARHINPPDQPNAVSIPLSIVREQALEKTTRVATAHTGRTASTQTTYGVLFQHRDDTATLALSRWVDHAILTHMGTPAHRATRTVQTDRLFTHTAQNIRIAMYHDYVGASDPMLVPIVVLAPDLGHTKEDALDLAYFLANQGLHVLRYDAPHHLGESDGHDASPSMSHLHGGLQGVLAFIEEFWPGTPIILGGTGLSGRLCARLLHSDAWIIGLALLHTAPDLTEELPRLHWHEDDPLSHATSGDMIAYYHGVRIQRNTFLDDALAARYVSAEDLLQDLRNTTVPIAIVTRQTHTPSAQATATADQWRQLLHGHPIDATLIDAQPDAPADVPTPQPPAWMKAIAQFCIAQLRHGHRPLTLGDMPQRDRWDEHQLERLRVRSQHLWTATQRRLHWAAFTALADSTLRTAITQALLPPLASNGTTRRILEVGCGHGELLTAIARHQTESEFPRARSRTSLSTYVGIEYTAATVEQARAKWVAAQARQTATSLAPQSEADTLTPQWLLGEFDTPLPIHNAHMDAIVIQPVVGHYINPRQLIHECWRLLAPGGRLILLSFHPTSDLTRWTRPMLATETAETRTPARARAHDALHHEWIRGWADGSLLRYSAEALRTLMHPLHLRTLTIEQALDGQAHLLIAHKP